MTTSPRLRSLALAGGAGFGLSLLSALPASAHGMAAGGTWAGLVHPLLGLDHLLLLVGVGAASSAIAASLLAWAVAGAVVGSLLGVAGTGLPAAEALAALAVSAVGLLLWRGLRNGHSETHVSAAGAVVAAAVAIHALLHGQEAPGGAGWWLGAAGGSLAVIGLSAALTRSLPPVWILRLAALLSLSGVALALAPLA